jgi:putative transposase
VTAPLDFLLTAKCDLASARRFLKRAIGQHGLPDKITIHKTPSFLVLYCEWHDKP